MSQLSVPLLNRLVDQMLERADPRADQNIWDLARAAEEVFRETKGEAIVAAYGGQKLTEHQRQVIANLNNDDLDPAKGFSPTGRMVMQPVPQTFAREDGGSPTGQIYSPPLPTQHLVADKPDFETQLGEAKRDLLAISDLIAGEPGTSSVTLFERVKSLVNARYREREQLSTMEPKYESALREIEQLRAKIIELAQYKDNFTAAQRQLKALSTSLQEVEGTTRELRETLDPDGQFEAETLGALARERMNLLAARRDKIKQLERELQVERA